VVNASITIGTDEPAERALKRLDRLLTREGFRAAMKRHEFRRTPSQARRLKSKLARAKARKAEKRIAVARGEYERRRFGSSET
jgi:ribosomal protein S21